MDENILKSYQLFFYIKYYLNNKNFINLNDNKIRYKLIETICVNIFIKFIISSCSGFLKKKSLFELKKKITNKNFCYYLDNQISEILKKNPNYTTCNAYEFSKTFKYEQFLSKFKDKKLKDNSKQLGKIVLDNLIDKLFGPKFIKFLLSLKILPIPDIVLKTSSNALIKFFTPFLKYFANVYGLSLNTGNLGSKLYHYNNCVFESGLEFGPNGLRITNIRAYFLKFNGTKKELVSVQIPNPPDSIFSKPVNEIKNDITKLSLMNHNELSKEIKQIIAEE